MSTPNSPQRTRAPTSQFLGLPEDVRYAIYKACVPADTLHISQRGFVCNQQPEKRLFTVTCRHTADIDFIVRGLSSMRLCPDEYQSIGALVVFPDHLDCIMPGIATPLHKHSGWLSLLLTCRSVHDEFIRILYSRPRFAFHDWYAFCRFFSTVPPQPHQAWIRSLCVAWGRGRDLFYQWKDIWDTIRRLPRPLSNLEIIFRTNRWVFLTEPEPTPARFRETRPPHCFLDEVYGYQMATNGQFVVTEVVVAPFTEYAVEPPTILSPEVRAKLDRLPFAIERKRLKYRAIDIEFRAQWDGFLDDSQYPPWHRSFPRTLALRHHRPLSQDERLAVWNLIYLRSGRTKWTPSYWKPYRKLGIRGMRRCSQEGRDPRDPPINPDGELIPGVEVEWLEESLPVSRSSSSANNATL